MPYNETVNMLVEEAYQNGLPEVDLDPERFLDFKKSLQRRRDDPTKRRAVDRSPGTLFANKVWVVGPDAEERSRLVTHLAACEDTLVLKRVHKLTDFVVVGEQWAKNATSKKLVAEAHSLGLPVITGTTVLRAVAEETFPPSGYAVVDAAAVLSDAKRLREEEEKAKKKAAVAASPPGKRARDDDFDDEQEIKMTSVAVAAPAPAKAQKVSQAPSLPAPALAPATVGPPSPGPATLATSPTGKTSISKVETVYSAPNTGSKAGASEESDTTPKIEDGVVLTFRGGSEWNGAVDDVPFVLAVSQLEAMQFSGIVTYPTLGMAKVRIQGRFKNGFQCEFTELSALSGDDFVVVGSVYHVKFTSDSAGEGSYAAADGSAGRVVMRLAKPPPATVLDVATPMVLQGYVLNPEAIQISITSLTDTTVTGSFRRGTAAPVKFTANRAGNEFVCEQFMCQLSTEGFGSGVVFGKGQNQVFFIRE